MTDKRNQSFLGRGWAFPPTFNKGPNALRMSEAEEDIRQSLGILLTTVVGERFLQPNYGCDLQKYVFDPMNKGTQAYIKDLVETAILYHEPRIEMLKLKMQDGSVDGELLIEIEYKIHATNTRSNYVFPFYKDEGTDIPK